MLLIGIDVGMQKDNTGIAVYDTNWKQYLELFSCSFYEMQMFLNGYPAKYKDKKIGVVLENANLDNATFIKGLTSGAMMKVSRDAGKNAGGAMILNQQLKVMGLPCVNVAPSKRQRAKNGRMVVGHLNMPTKVSAKQFKQLTRYSKTKGNNEHSRDAATLVWGMNSRGFALRLKLQADNL